MAINPNYYDKIKEIEFEYMDPFNCFNCGIQIIEFKKSPYKYFDVKSRTWKNSIMTECPYCKELFGVTGLN